MKHLIELKIMQSHRDVSDLTNKPLSNQAKDKSLATVIEILTINGLLTSTVKT